MVSCSYPYYRHITGFEAVRYPGSLNGYLRDHQGENQLKSASAKTSCAGHLPSQGGTLWRWNSLNSSRARFVSSSGTAVQSPSLRQSRRLDGCWPLKEASSQPVTNTTNQFTLVVFTRKDFHRPYCKWGNISFFLDPGPRSTSPE